MRERPILFSDPMVRAILSGSKRQTRRPVKGEPLRWLDVSGFDPSFVASPENHLSPFGFRGDRLWVRECFAEVDFNSCLDGGMSREDFVWCTKPGDVSQGDHPILYRATCGAFEWDDRPESRWHPSIHMPRWASRLTLRVTDVRVERVQDITEDDARAEGVGFHVNGERDAFRVLWRETYGPESWTANPWVWVVSFERLEVPS